MPKPTNHERKLLYWPTWRLVIVLGIYCATVTQIGALIIFSIEQKPIHPIGNILLLVGTAATAILGQVFGHKDLQRIRNLGGQLEITRAQGIVVAFCCAMVPGALLILVILSGV